MTRKIAFMIALLACLPTFAARAESWRALVAPQVSLPTQISLREAVRVEGDRLYLADIADCQGVATVCSRTYGIDLGAAPAPGQEFNLGREHLRLALIGEGLIESIELSGAHQTRVRAEGVEISRGYLVNWLETYLAELIGEDADLRVQVIDVALMRSIMARSPDFDLAVPQWETMRFDNESQLISSLNGFRKVDLVIRSRAMGMADLVVPLRCRFEVQVRVPTAGRHLPRGRIVEPDDLDLNWVAARRGGIVFARLSSEVVGRVLKRSLDFGQPIPVNAVDRPMAVKRGEIVEIAIAQGGLSLSSRGKAMSNGAVGDVIPVMSNQSNKTIQALVRAPGRVEATF